MPQKEGRKKKQSLVFCQHMGHIINKHIKSTLQSSNIYRNAYLQNDTRNFHNCRHLHYVMAIVIQKAVDWFKWTQFTDVIFLDDKAEDQSVIVREHKSFCFRNLVFLIYPSVSESLIQSTENSVLRNTWVSIQNIHKPTTENLTQMMYIWHERNSIVFSNTWEMGKPS